MYRGPEARRGLRETIIRGAAVPLAALALLASCEGGKSSSKDAAPRHTAAAFNKELKTYVNDTSRRVGALATAHAGRTEVTASDGTVWVYDLTPNVVIKEAKDKRLIGITDDRISVYRKGGDKNRGYFLDSVHRKDGSIGINYLRNGEPQSAGGNVQYQYDDIANDFSAGTLQDGVAHRPLNRKGFDNRTTYNGQSFHVTHTRNVKSQRRDVSLTDGMQTFHDHTDDIDAFLAMTEGALEGTTQNLKLPS